MQRFRHFVHHIAWEPLIFVADLYQSPTRLTTCRLTENAEQLAAKEMFSKQMILFKYWNTQSVVSCFISFLALISSVRGMLTEDAKGKENSRKTVQF